MEGGGGTFFIHQGARTQICRNMALHLGNTGGAQGFHAPTRPFFSGVFWGRSLGSKKYLLKSYLVHERGYMTYTRMVDSYVEQW